MKRFRVVVREVWVRHIVVHAATGDEAVSKAARGRGETLDVGLEYSHELSPDHWTVEEEPLRPESG